MEISALTRSVVTSNHALISPDGYVGSTVPGWMGCSVHVLISKEMGARFSQTLITCRPGAALVGYTAQLQHFFYVVSGAIRASANGDTKTLTAGQYIFIPEWREYHLDEPAEGTRLVSFHKVYEPLEGASVPNTLFGDSADAPAVAVLGDPAVRMQVLLPEDCAYDMAINILSFDPGGYLPMVETHIMEHGLLFLQGQGIYRLGQDWYPVKKGDAIWMAPYCQQWFAAMGKEPAVYIFYKNVNRHPA